jgi:hypothetical protein
MLAMVATTADASLVYDAAADFSPTNNPNGVWSYGQSATLTSPFVLYTSTAPNTGIPELDYWSAGSAGTFALPAVFHNGTGQVVINETITMQPGQLAFHPGPADQFSVVRFTSPSDGIFSLATIFSPVDSLAKTDVHILLNNVPLFAGTVDRASTSFDANLNLHAGDELDFKVGFGSNGNFLNDSTGLSARISATVPEPDGLVTFGIGLLGVLVYARSCNVKASGPQNRRPRDPETGTQLTQKRGRS